MLMRQTNANQAGANTGRAQRLFCGQRFCGTGVDHCPCGSINKLRFMIISKQASHTGLPDRGISSILHETPCPYWKNQDTARYSHHPFLYPRYIVINDAQSMQGMLGF
jgi:hypothetical protein